MRKKQPTLKRLITLCASLNIMLLAGSIFFAACNGIYQPAQQHVVSKILPPVVKNITGANVPKTIQITAANLPKVTVAGKPTIKVDSSHGGAAYFTSYGTQQGMPMSTILCSAADADGNMWFGTPGAGASRYNGKSFTNYTIAQGLAENTVTVIYPDKQGNIWFGSGSSGVCKFNGKSFTNYTTAQGLADNYVFTIMQDRQGYIWFGTRNGGVSRYDGKKFTNYTTAQGLADNFITCMQQDDNGDILFITAGGISRYNGKAFTTLPGLEQTLITGVLRDGAGSIWLTTFGKGLKRIDGKTITSYTTAQGLVGDKALCIAKDMRGNIWIGTDTGVSRFNGKSFTNYTAAQGLPGTYVRSITQDNAGNLWFGIEGAGVCRHNGESTAYFTAAQGLPAQMLYSTTRDTAGNMWFATWGGGVSRYNGKTFTTYNRAQGLLTRYVDRVMADKAGNIWISGDGRGLNRFDGKAFTLYTTKQGLPSNVQFAAMEDRSGNIWLGTDSGACKFDGKSFTNYTRVQGLPSNSITTIAQDKAGNMWFGTDSGVSRFDGKSFTNYAKAQGLPDNIIFCSTVDSAGNVWFGSSGGISIYNGGGFTNYTRAQGLPDNNVEALLQSPGNNAVWVGTNQGLCKLTKQNAGNGYNIKIFNENTGYPIKDIDINGLIVDGKGIVWATCGDNRAIKFDENAIDKNTAPLTLAIENIKLNGENISWYNLATPAGKGTAADSLALINETVTAFGSALPAPVLDSMRQEYSGVRFDSITRFYPIPVNLVLPYKDRNITIDFAAAEPARPKQVQYKYMLQGYDKGWSTLSNNTTAVFGNLPGGSYTFKLKALSPDGVWSSTDYKFRVLPPWYKTWWAYTLYVLLLIIAVWCFVYYRSRSLLKANRNLESKVKMRTEEVLQQKEEIEVQRDSLEVQRNDLEKVLGELKSTQSQLIQSEKMASLGDLTAGIAHEIQNPLNFVNNFSEVSNELIDEMNDELNKGDIEEAKAIAADVKQNLEKINHHGKRADSIVKGMLQHSRKSTGQKELTDINALADEYLRLSYHGLRAKDKSFNAELITHFDGQLPKINAAPQDIGRVLVNLFNNAFYAVREKSKIADAAYKPAVEVTTSLQNGRVIIAVKDNGTGIPDAIKEKIMQPFFTTKPTGEGTGLGLSLSYDIIVKGHAGTIEVNSAVGEFTEFIIDLPLKG